MSHQLRNGYCRGVSIDHMVVRVACFRSQQLVHPEQFERLNSARTCDANTSTDTDDSRISSHCIPCRRVGCGIDSTSDDSFDSESSGLIGCWSGEWRSCSTGHRGPMTADFCRLRCDCYEVTFKGRFCKLIPFRYKAILHASVGEDGSVVLTGSKNLGLLFGTFRFRGSVDGCRLHANYCSKDDTGTICPGDER